ncbi:MAG: restriction endonuclease [Rubrobacteraceae bacterium]
MKSDLPNSSQFSPTQTPLPELLEIVERLEPDRESVTQEILARFYPGRDIQLAKNTVIAMSQYGLVNKPKGDQAHVSLTDLGRNLVEKVEQGQYDEFARHILLRLRGLDALTCVQDIVASGRKPTKALIVKELRSRGIHHPPNGTHANSMRQWLELSELVSKNEWNPKEEKLQELLGTNLETLEIYAGLTQGQRDFAKAFARLDTEEARSNEVARYATSLFGTEFAEGGLPQSVLFALRDAELIEVEKTTSGQGAKPYIVRPTGKLKSELIEPILTAIEDSVGVQYRKLIRMKYTDILSGLSSKSKHEKGLALEALAFYLARLLGLEFVQWRLRSNKTGGGEVDVVMEGARLIFSRWQIQCKNSSQATLEDIAKEVGLAQVIKANVILIVTTGKIGPAARQFAEQVMREANLYVALIDGSHLNELRGNPAKIADIMNTQAEGAMAIKRGQVIL